MRERHEKESIVRQLHDNYLESKGIVKVARPAHPKAKQKPQPSSSVPRPSVNSNAGSKDANREQEIENGMDLDIDDENTQRAKWRR